MNFNQHKFILCAIESLIAAKGGTGRTHIQKTLFVANELYDLHIPFHFILYKHGPYSFDVDSAIQEMKSYRAISIEPVPGYGVSITPDKGKHFVEEYGGELDQRPTQAITEVSRFLAQMHVKELERIATAVWIYFRENIREPDRISERLRQLKPHVSDKGAQEAVNTFQKLLSNPAS